MTVKIAFTKQVRETFANIADMVDIDDSVELPPTKIPGRRRSQRGKSMIVSLAVPPGAKSADALRARLPETSRPRRRS
jgi:hypothetical protein